MAQEHLIEHTPHQQPQNVNEAHAAERLSLNDRIAVFISKNVGTMQCAYIFAVIGIASLIGAVGGNVFLALTFGALSSYFLQLVLLPIIMVGQNVQARHGELQADEAYKTALRTLHDARQLVAHLHAQDDLLRLIPQILKTQDLILDRLQITSEPDTGHHRAITKLTDTTLHINTEGLNAALVDAYQMPCEVVSAQPVEMKLLLYWQRPHRKSEAVISS